MKASVKLFFGIGMLFAATAGFIGCTGEKVSEDTILSYTVDVKKQDLRFYWKYEEGKIFRSFENLKRWLHKQDKVLVFAANGGMFQENRTPLGLFIQDGKTIKPLNTSSGYGNFYLKPNGVFYITKDRRAGICKTEFFKSVKQVCFATQSGPMLVIDGNIHPAFRKESTNVNIRNGVGILPDNKVVFAMSKEMINFYEFADYFRRLGCKNALYLDGFVSRTYLLEKDWVQSDGDFGVIIAVTADL